MRGKENTTSGQWERGCKTGKARENSGDQGAVSFRLESDWLKGWSEFSGPILRQTKAKPSHTRVPFGKLWRYVWQIEKRNGDQMPDARGYNVVKQILHTPDVLIVIVRQPLSGINRRVPPGDALYTREPPSTNQTESRNCLWIFRVYH